MVALLKMPRRVPPPRSGGNDGGSTKANGLSLASFFSDTPKKLERRVFPRKEVRARIEGRRLDHSLLVYKQPSISLALRDLSAGGLSAVSEIPLQAGERVTVFFPPQGIMRGWDAYGRVVRCEPSAMGFRIAVEFDALPAA